MSKGKKVKIVIEGIILLFIVYCVVLKMLPVSTGRLSTYEEINDAVATAASRYKNTVTLKTTGEPYIKTWLHNTAGTSGYAKDNRGTVYGLSVGP